MSLRRRAAHTGRNFAPKRAFDTEVEAQRWARLLEFAGIADCLLEAYECEQGDHWHLGHPLPAEPFSGDPGEQIGTVTLLEETPGGLILRWERRAT